MFYDPADIEKLLECSYCQQKFVDVVKLLPGCCESICEDCHQEILDNRTQLGDFKCKVCQSVHLMPEAGLPNNIGLVRILKKPKIQKPMNEDARMLKDKLTSVQEQIKSIKTFDARDHINLYCDQLELEVREAIDSAVKALNEIETDLLNDIKAYRKKCLDSLAINETQSPDMDEELNTITEEINEFRNKWNDYFNRIEALARDKEIDDALVEVQEFEIRIGKLDAIKKSSVFNGEKMVFRPKDLIFMKKVEWQNFVNLFVFCDPSKGIFESHSKAF